MIAAVSPSMLSYEDTYNTLKYANRAKEIKLLVGSQDEPSVSPIWSFFSSLELRIPLKREKISALRKAEL